LTITVGIHQPQYLPWLPLFLKIQQCDVFIILDSVDFQKNGLQNRNQIKTVQGPHWLTVPVCHHTGQKIIDVKVDNGGPWHRKHWQTILHNYGKAKAFSTYEKDLNALYMREWIWLCDLNIEVMMMMMRWMKIQTPILRSSQMKAVGSASDLVLNLCLEVGGSRYLSGTGGKNYLVTEAFDRAAVEICYTETILPKMYPQLATQAGFIDCLSALDIMLNCGEEWAAYLPEKIVKC